MAESYTGEAYCVKCKEKREFTGNVGDRATGSDLHRGPFGAAGRQQAVLGGDAMIGTGPAGPRTVGLPTDQPVFAPRQAHRLAVHGQVDVAHGRAFLDLAGGAAVWAQPINDGLLELTSRGVV